VGEWGIYTPKKALDASPMNWSTSVCASDKE
jgi:hypothetical protein